MSNYYIKNGIVKCAKCHEDLEYCSQTDTLSCFNHNDVEVNATDITIDYCTICGTNIYGDIKYDYDGDAMCIHCANKLYASL